MQVAALAKAPPAAGIWEIFRKVRDPGRNILGFDKSAAIHFGLVLAGVALVAQTPAGARLFSAQRDFTSLAREAGDLQKMTLACELGFVGINPGGMKCDAKALDAKSSAMNTRLGLPDYGAIQRASDREVIDSLLARRCFHSVHDMTPAALTGPPQGKRYNMQPGRMSSAALTSVEPLLRMPPGPERDRKLRDYADFRLLMIENALYFNGPAELETLNANYHRDDHDRVIALLGERLKDPGFTTGAFPNTIAKLRVLAASPFEALPCDVVPKPASIARP